MVERLLVRYGDLSLKGRNKIAFIKRVNSLIKEKLSDFNVEYEFAADRAYIILNGNDLNDIIKALNHVSGLHSYSLVERCNLDMDEINEAGLEIIKKEYKEGQTFKVEARRAYKNFEFDTMEILKKSSAYILSHMDNMKVDVHNPDLVLHIEIRNDGAFLFTNSIRAMGGYPVGVGGKGLLMLSGGIDSPVAGYLAMKQGVEIECIHFESTPLTSVESSQKVIEIVKKLAPYAPKNRIKLHMVPFKKLHEAFIKNIDDSYLVTLMRRYMYRISSEIAKRNNLLAIFNGESIGQVASQTLESMNVINSVTNTVIIRPLATYDKQDIIKISRMIDCYDISIRPFEDCCTVYLPKNPVIKPTLKEALYFESKANFDELMSEAIDNTLDITITKDTDLELSLYGFTVSEAYEEYLKIIK